MLPGVSGNELRPGSARPVAADGRVDHDVAHQQDHDRQAREHEAEARQPAPSRRTLQAVSSIAADLGTDVAGVQTAITLFTLSS
jgi:hypothetical protein